MGGVIVALASFAGCLGLGYLLLAARGRQGDEEPTRDRATASSGWVADASEPSAGTHVWVGRAPGGPLRTPPSCAAIIAGPPRSGKTRKVIAPTLASWAGPVLVTSTKGDILATAAARAAVGPVWVYDPTGSLGSPQTHDRLLAARALPDLGRGGRGRRCDALPGLRRVSDLLCLGPG